MDVFDTLDDLEDNTQEMSQKTQSILHETYGNSPTRISFVRAELKTGPDQTYHPLGYMLPFENLEDILIPTKHAHGDDNDAGELADDWDHHITIMSDDNLVNELLQKKLDLLGFESNCGGKHDSRLIVSRWDDIDLPDDENILKQLNNRRCFLEDEEEKEAIFGLDLLSSGCVVELRGTFPNVDLGLLPPTEDAREKARKARSETVVTAVASTSASTPTPPSPASSASPHPFLSPASPNAPPNGSMIRMQSAKSGWGIFCSRPTGL